MAGEGQHQRSHDGDGGAGGGDDPDQERGVLPDLVEVRRLPLAPLFAATGAALVIYVTSEISLALAVVITVAIFLGVFAAGWFRIPLAQRAEAKRRVVVGIAAGAAGTAAYDAIRVIHVAVVDLRFPSFDILEAFGTALLGEGRAEWMVMTAGIGFHVTIGVGLVTAYTLVLRRPNVVNGVVFALVLGTFAVVIIPNWLGTEEVFLEFLAVSAVGHLVYGAMAGGVAQWLLGRWRPAEGPEVADGAS